MSLSINAPEWNPATNQSKGNGNIRTQENTGGGQSHRGKSKDGSVSHSHRGGGRNRRGGGPIESSNSSNNPNSHHHHQQQSHPSQRGRGGGSRGGGGGGSHRGGSRGGGRSSSSHVYDDAHPIVSDEISDADALAIAAALSEDHAPSAPPVMPNVTRSSSQSSSHHSHSHSHSHTPSPADILGFKFERTTLQETRFLNRPRSFPKGKPSEVFNKNQYMQANHFFILGEDDPASFLLPDHPLDWSKVELVICPVDNEARVCPICLEPPTAATITKCGHVFCMTCMLQYFAQSQRSWSKCPLCHDSVYPQSLKSAEFRVHPKVREGDTIEFMLMCRSKDSVNASPLMESLSSEEQSYFTRMRRTHDISAIVQRELRQLFQLRALSRSTNDTTPLPFIDQAEANIVKRITAWSDAHPYWKMKSPTYEEMKEAENHKYAEEEIERRRRAERATSILARTEEWPELPKSNRPLSRTNSTTAQSAATSTQQQSAVPYTPSPVPRPISTLSASPSSSSLTPAPTSTSTSATSNLPPSSTSSSGSSSPSFTSSTPSTPIQTPTPSHIPKPYRAGQQQQQQHQQQHQSQQSSSLQPNLNQQQHQSDMYYFYQSSDGQQLYLHSLNFRSLLLTHCNDVHSLPSRIRGKVVHRDTYLMDSNVRSKFRFLSHLPLTASFALTLVDFDSSHPPSFVSKEAQAQLASEFAADRKARQLAAKKQRELNKRSIMTSKAAAMGDQDETTKSGNSNGSMSFANWQLDAASAASFPDLHNPLGLASAAPLPPPVATASPDLRPNNWNIVASKGLASSELWPSLAEAAAGGAGATPTSTPASASSSNSGGSGSHWGASSGPLTIGRPTPIWGKTNSASSSNSNKSTGDAESANEEDQLPPSFQNRKGQNVILASGSRRAYK